MSLRVVNIGELVTNDPSMGDGTLGPLHDAALVVEDGRVAWVGPSSRCPDADEPVSYTHLDVYKRQRSP